MVEIEQSQSVDLTADELRQIVDGFRTASIFVLGPDGRVRFHNRLARQIAATSVDADRWLHDGAFHDPALKRALRPSEKPLARLANEPTKGPMVVGWLDERGDERLLEFCLSAFPRGDLRLLSIVDVTYSSALREAVRQAERAIGKGQDVADVTHGLGNVFGIVQMAGMALADLSLPALATAKIRDILDAGKRGVALVDRLQGSVFHEEETAPVTDVIALLQSTARLATRIMPSSVTFTADLPTAPRYCTCDHAELEAALIQVLSHARKAVLGNGGGQVSLALVDGPTTIGVKISYDGQDLSAANLAEIDDPYSDRRQAADGDNDALEEAGATARRAGGAMDISARSGGGAHILFTLPATTEPEPATQAPLTRARQNLAGYRVLVAESDGSLRALLTEALRQMGATVAAVATGHEAIRTLSRQDGPDVVIANPSFRDGTTAETLAETLTDANAATRLILLSATFDLAANRDVRPRALRLRKPLDLDVLANAIRLSPPHRG